MYDSNGVLSSRVSCFQSMSGVGIEPLKVLMNECRAKAGQSCSDFSHLTVRYGVDDVDEVEGNSQQGNVSVERALTKSPSKRPSQKQTLDGVKF